MREREGGGERQTDRQTDRQRRRQGQIDRQRETETERDRDRQNLREFTAQGHRPLHTGPANVCKCKSTGPRVTLTLLFFSACPADLIK